MNFLTQTSPVTAFDPRTAVIALLVAFACSHVLAVVYVWSHRGISYSQSFVQSLVMAPMGSCLMMLVIGTNVVLGIGMIGALALVRFRTNLRDPRDMMFVFIALVVGLASGTLAYAIAVIGTVMFSLLALYLGRMSFGFRNYFDALLRFTLRSTEASAAAVQECLTAHCSRFTLTMVQQVFQGEATEHVYQIRFRSSDSRDKLIQQLEQLSGVTNLSMMLEEARVDI
ncbi:MAG: DUF4956 domain-containing protein [Acidobacteria bacterium]|nr:DUF4956 domain-containing protein [Acidobacteriota bacterium]